MSFYGSYPVFGGNGIAIYPTFSAFPAASTVPAGTVAIAANTEILYASDGTNWLIIGGPGVALSLGAFGSSPNANGGTISSNVLTLQPASASFPGGVTTGTQSFAGNKTFTGSISASNLSGTNTGDVTLGTASGLSVTGQVLSLGLSSTSTTGALSSTDWNTFNNKQPAGNYITALTGDATAAGPGSSALTLATVNSNVGSFTNASITVNAKGLITAASSGAAPVTSIAIATANGLAGSSSGGSTPTITLSTTVTGILSGNGTAISAASTTGSGAVVLANAPTFTGAPSMGSNLIHNVTDPVAAQDAATKNYVDLAVAALNPATAVYAATAGSNIPGTYLNGVAGVGATFTTTATGVFTVDGVTPPLSSRILIKDQSSGFQNGIYDITTLGSIGVSTIFTRSFDYDTPSDVNGAGLIPVINGTVNALSSWQQVAVVTTIGTDSLVFTEFTANPSLYLLKANNLNDVSNSNTSFNNISPLTTKGDVLGYSTVNARLGVGSNGQVLTADSTQTLGIKWATPTVGTVTSVSVTTANGVSGSVATATTTPAITLTLGAITPSSVAATGTVTGSNLSGTNTGDQTITLTGDVTGSGTGSFATTIATNVVTNAKLAQMAAHTFKGNNTGSTANALDLTATQLTAELDTFVGDSGSGGTKGLVPAPAAGDAAAGKFLKADGTWTAGIGGAYIGDITISGSSGVWATSSTSFTNYSAQTGTSYSVTGSVAAPATNIPGFKLSGAAGKYVITYTGALGQQNNTSDCAYFRMSDGTTASNQIGMVRSINDVNYSPSMTWVIVEGTSFSNVTFQIQARTSSGGGSATAQGMNIGSNQSPGNFSVIYYP